MTERLQKIIASRGVTSRRKAEEMILAGRVTCNGRVSVLGESADPDKDIILLDGNPLPSGSETMYIMLNKPKGYVTTLADEKGRKNAAQLVSDCGCRVYPVGRLDMDSEGLLLFTNDGDFANKLMHPKHEVNKTYRVWVKGYAPNAVEQLKKPVILDGYTISKPSVRIISVENKENAELEIIIHEGRNRQVRRMCAMVGMKVLRLVRIAEGAVFLGDLPAGKWRRLTERELELLQE